MTLVVADQPYDISTRGAMTHVHMSVRARQFSILNIYVYISVYYIYRGRRVVKCGRQ